MMKLICRIALVALTVLATTTAWAEQSDGWYPSRWGAADTLGAANLINNASVKAAASLVKQGKRYALGMEITRNTPAFGSRIVETFVVSHAGIFGNAGEAIAGNQATGNDDWALVFFGVGTQIDGLGHVGINHHYYNGKHISEFFRQDGLTTFSTSDIPPIVARGIVLDMVGYFADNAPHQLMQAGGVSMLKPAVAINEAEIKGALKRQGLNLARGDVVLLHTGYMARADVDAEAYMAAIPGLGLNGGQFLAAHEPVAVGADTFGLEIQPGEDPAVLLPVHQELLARNGIYILENIVTHELVEDQAWEFMFVLGQARIRGTVQMIINPIAIR